MKTSSEQSAPAVSVVIPTWSRCGLICACLESLGAQTFRDFEAVVVDDGSTDDTVAVVSARFPEARVVALGENRGFAIAVNAGIRASRGTAVFLLNNDMTLEPDCLARLWEGLGDAQMAAPLVLWRDAPEVVYSAGDRIAASALPTSWGFRAPRAEFVPRREVFGVSGGAGLIRREVFDRVGLLDERFGAYFEDADFCYRARLAGFRAVCVPEAVAYHIGSASIAGNTWWRSAQCWRNHALLVFKDVPFPLLLLHAAPILLERANQTFRMLSAARAHGGAVFALHTFLKTWCGLWARIPHALAARWGIQRARRISLGELRRLLREGDA